MWRSHHRNSNIYEQLLNLIIKYYTLDTPCNLQFPKWYPEIRTNPDTSRISRLSSSEEEDESNPTPNEEEAGLHSGTPIASSTQTVNTMMPPTAAPSEANHLDYASSDDDDLFKYVTILKSKTVSKNIRCPATFVPSGTVQPSRPSRNRVGHHKVKGVSKKIYPQKDHANYDMVFR